MIAIRHCERSPGFVRNDGEAHERLSKAYRFVAGK
jgi:hypothetical protein